MFDNKNHVSSPWSVACLQLESALQLERGDSRIEDPNSKSLVHQNVDLRRRLEDEHGAYKRKLHAFQEGQQRQAQLVQKLQAKVIIHARKLPIKLCSYISYQIIPFILISTPGRIELRYNMCKL